ncbi:uncharacterized protein TNCV_1408981 [Trichonephila clavipes]|uniref:DUF4817 domain-containing protein n=1 Tax=Trichonephila clavipes TaxID=2585209 RepID=A0A8X6RAA1_TRICX|nr:uncharacterized protein TNCV_1408981 [Trichonephila clavipes]
MPSINSVPKPRAISSTIEARKEVSVPKEEIKTMYSIEERVFLVLEYHRLQESPTATRRSFQARFSVPKGPEAKTIRSLFAKFQRTGSVTDDLVGNVGRKQTAVTPQNVATVSGIIQQNPMSSVRRTASEAGLKRSSTQKILRKSLHMFPFKIQTHHAVPFTDEAHFHLNGFVSKQNWRFWGSENPYWCEVKPLYSPKVTVWAAVCSRDIIGPFFIRETVTSERYVTILEQFVATQQVLENRPRTEWFMQDGARPHRTEQVFRFLEYFGNRVIALEYPKFTGAGMDWPPYSPDLTPCDYFLWGTLKDTVYSKHPATLDELESAICVACESISVETLRNVMANFILRLRHLSCANGEHFEHIVM